MKSDDARIKLFALIDEFVLNEVHNAILRGMAISYAYDARMEGFDQASEVSKREVEKAFHPQLALQMRKK